MSDSRIVVVGSLNLDRTYTVRKLPREGESLHADDHRTSPGGKGANQAIAAARMGASVSLVGAVGADRAGTKLRNAAADAGVDVTHVRVDQTNPTGEAVILVDELGRNLIIVSRGANDAVSARDVTGADIPAGWIVSGFEVPDGAVVEAARRAREIGARFVLNPSPFRAIPELVVGHIDVLVLNEHELETALGAATQTSSDAALRAARDLLGTGLLVVTLGADGAAAVSEDHVFRAPGLAVSAVDTSGAGDAFTGVLIALLASGRHLGQALERAVAAAAYAVTRPGTQGAYPTAADLDAWLDRRSELSTPKVG